MDIIILDIILDAEVEIYTARSTGFNTGYEDNMDAFMFLTGFVVDMTLVNNVWTTYWM